MSDNEEKRKTILPEDKSSAIEKSQADSKSEIREGQENSSILHDDYDKDSELPRDVRKPDISSNSQEEFVDNDKNTKKESE